MPQLKLFNKVLSHLKKKKKKRIINGQKSQSERKETIKSRTEIYKKELK
jgi:hypothetical protein